MNLGIGAYIENAVLLRIANNIPDESGINTKGNFEIGRILHLSRGAANMQDSSNFKI